MSDTGYYVYAFDRGQFWKKNQLGYTHDVLEAGLFDYEDSLEILKSSNMVSVEAEMVHVSNVKRLSSIKKEEGIKYKKDMLDCVLDLTKEDHQNNPLEKVKEALFNNGYYAEEDMYQHLKNGERKRYALYPYANQSGLNVVIERKDNGNYELIINRIGLESKNKIIPSIKKINKLNN
jgi:hypothetical protein